MFECVNVSDTKQPHKTLVISENLHVTKRGEERNETKGTEQVIRREKKKKIEKDPLGHPLNT